VLGLNVVLSGGTSDLKQGYRRLLATGVSYAICMTVEHTLGANNGSLRRVCGGGVVGGMRRRDMGRFRPRVLVAETRNGASSSSNTRNDVRL